MADLSGSALSSIVIVSFERLYATSKIFLKNTSTGKYSWVKRLIEFKFEYFSSPLANNFTVYLTILFSGRTLYHFAFN